MATSMAPLKIGRSGWMSTAQIFLTHYGSHVSHSRATPTQGTDYVGVSEAAGLSPLRRSVTHVPVSHANEATEVTVRAAPSDDTLHP